MMRGAATVEISMLLAFLVLVLALVAAALGVLCLRLHNHPSSELDA